MSQNRCPVCNSPFAGRADKKYCSDQCRYLANNKNKLQTERPIIELNRALRKNRSILRKLCPAGRAIVRKEVMKAMGYDETIFTSIFVTSKKQIYYICYDYAFTPTFEHNVAKAVIVSKQVYMNFWDPWKYVRKDV